MSKPNITGYQIQISTIQRISKQAREHLGKVHQKSQRRTEKRNLWDQICFQLHFQPLPYAILCTKQHYQWLLPLQSFISFPPIFLTNRDPKWFTSFSSTQSYFHNHHLVWEASLIVGDHPKNTQQTSMAEMIHLKPEPPRSPTFKPQSHSSFYYNEGIPRQGNKKNSSFDWNSSWSLQQSTDRNPGPQNSTQHQLKSELRPTEIRSERRSEYWTGEIHLPRKQLGYFGLPVFCPLWQKKKRPHGMLP